MNSCTSENITNLLFQPGEIINTPVLFSQPEIRLWHTDPGKKQLIVVSSLVYKVSPPWSLDTGGGGEDGRRWRLMGW